MALGRTVCATLILPSGLLRHARARRLGVVGNIAVFTVAWTVGLALRHAAQSSAAAGARPRRAKAERRRAAGGVAEERLRIAQELHDVVAHSMSVIAVQAGVGAHVLDDRPGEAKAALEPISATSRGTLNEMRRLLGVLRDEEGDRSHAPAPGLADLPRLVEDVQGRRPGRADGRRRRPA